MTMIVFTLVQHDNREKLQVSEVDLTSPFLDFISQHLFLTRSKMNILFFLLLLLMLYSV